MFNARLLLAALALLLTAIAPLAADQEAELEAALRAFLAGADQRSVHETFWAEDLIYSSSAGERFGKSDILAGFEQAPADSPAGPSYGAEDLTIRIFGDLAVATFRLTADDRGERIGEYFNTGVFRREAGRWKAFTWQATRIPEVE